MVRGQGCALNRINLHALGASVAPKLMNSYVSCGDYIGLLNNASDPPAGTPGRVLGVMLCCERTEIWSQTSRAEGPGSLGPDFGSPAQTCPKPAPEARSGQGHRKSMGFRLFDPGPGSSGGPREGPDSPPWAFPRPPGPRTNQSRHLRHVKELIKHWR